MTKKSILMILLLMAMLSLTCTNVYANPTEIPLQVGYVNPDGGDLGQQRGPVFIPSVCIDGYSLVFNTPIDGYTLRLLDEDGYVVFTYVVNPDPNIYACCWFEPAEVQYKLCPVTVPAAIWQSKNNMVFSINPDNTSFSIDIWKDNINGDFNVIWTILQF